MRAQARRPAAPARGRGRGSGWPDPGPAPRPLRPPAAARTRRPPPPIPVERVRYRRSATPCPAPNRHSPMAAAIPSFSSVTGAPSRSCRAARSGKSAKPASDCMVPTTPALVSSGPGAATPIRAIASGAAARAAATRLAIWPSTTSGPACERVGRLWRKPSVPSSATTPTRTCVPPRSTALADRAAKVRVLSARRSARPGPQRLQKHRLDRDAGLGSDGGQHPAETQASGQSVRIPARVRPSALKGMLPMSSAKPAPPGRAGRQRGKRRPPRCRRTGPDAGPPPALPGTPSRRPANLTEAPPMSMTRIAPVMARGPAESRPARRGRRRHAPRAPRIWAARPAAVRRGSAGPAFRP